MQQASQDITTLVGELSAPDYTQALQPCDLVMKGGVTSGVVYPATICRLARTYKFSSIGGTSAGALAAALAAAAEHERGTRAHPADGGFNRLAKVPAYLGGGTHLRDLFQPSGVTATLFALAMAILQLEKKTPRNMAVAAVKTYGQLSRSALLVGLGVLIVLLLVIWFIAASCSDENLWRRGAIILVAVVTALGVAFLSAVVAGAMLIGGRVLSTVRDTVPANHFGLCTGLEKPDADAPRPLTLWLGDQIDYIAGLAAQDVQPDTSVAKPLTFGDLYGESDPSKYHYPTGSPVLDALNDRSGRRVNLEMVTTDVTAGRPYRLPFDPTDDVKFFYDPAEFAAFFPPRVLRQMAQGAEPFSADVLNIDQPVKLLPFPDAPDLPVIVAARMSMSFPILFSAVPLYAVHREAYDAARTNNAKLPLFRKTYFSDGGLSSNIPIHFFDGPVPRWPTFALNLRGVPQTLDGMPAPYPSHPTDKDKVFLATNYDPDVATVDPRKPGSLFAFVNSILDAMQNWNDNTLMRLPGYRERTVEIAMSSDEGGLNLVMPPETLTSIMTRGFYAGALFEETFASQNDVPTVKWNDHRHIRLRSTLLMQSEWSRRFAVAFDAGLTPSYPDLISKKEPYSMPYDDKEVPSATAFARYLADAPQQIAQGVTLTKKPHPAPEMRARPRV